MSAQGNTVSGPGLEAAIRWVQRQRDRGVEAVERAVDELLQRSLHAPSNAGPPIEDLVRIYEAAVHVSFSARLGDQALTLLLSQPSVLGSDEQALSRALLFATAADRLTDLLNWLRDLRAGLTDPEARFAGLLASAKLSLVQNDPGGMLHHADQAARLEPSVEPKRAERLSRAAGWLVAPSPTPWISRWRLRGLHHLLPREVAERLEDDNVGASPTVQRILDAATGTLHEAARIAEDPYGRQPRFREVLGAWALAVGSAIAASEEASGGGAAVPFTGAAWRLLELDLPETVIEAHARAVGTACAGLDEPDVRTTAERVARAMPASDGQARLFVPGVVAAWRGGRTLDGSTGRPATDLVDRLRAVSSDRPPPRPETAVPGVAYRLAGVPEEVRQAIERCLMDRMLLLPDEAPFRGRRWFESSAAHAKYLAGRDESDGVASYKDFEEAWLIEPNNTAAIQGLIVGLRRRLREKPGRDHLLGRFASLLDQMNQREVEAALAYTSLAELAERANHQMERRRWLRLAVRALRRRVSVQPWIRARNAEIALQLELGDLAAAGSASWDEAQLHLQGTPASRSYALLAATLWERASTDQPVDHDLVDEAHERAQSPTLTTLDAVRYAARIGHLVLLTDLPLDEEALEALWMECRGNEDDLCRFLQKQGTRAIDPRPYYLGFLQRKLEQLDPYAVMAPAAGRPEGAVSGRLAQLRLAAAEVLSQDPLQLASPAVALADPDMSEFKATLRQCAHFDEGAVKAFISAVEEALNALFMLRDSAQPAVPELLVSYLGTASRSVGLVQRTAERFRDPEVVEVARLMWRHLALALESPMKDVYLSEKARRLVPSQLGIRLDEWWASLSAETGQLDLFHVHLVYRCPKGKEPMRWWESSEGQVRPAKDAVRDLTRSLEGHAHRLDAIDDHYQKKRARLPGPRAFGLRDEFDACLRVLHAALAPEAGPDNVCAVAGALERLGTALRRIDMTRLTDVPELLYDPALTSDLYLLPRAVDLLTHWRQNTRSEPSLQVVLEVQDATGQDVLCVMSLDAATRPVPATVRLRGLAPFADLVEALGGQFHLWVARSGEPSGCRCEHHDGWDCEADEYVRRIEERLRELAEMRPAQQSKVAPWIRVLDVALRSNGNAAVAFALVPGVQE
jgi:hypothetical protein